ncbi:MAG: FAD-dependent oxidoreductase [Chloroflexi bacterium]|nr:FAD-dependent oxidoreductase [Chloroflexota bacterium]
MSLETATTRVGEPSRHPVIVVGAGMAGLVAAVALFEAGIPVHVYEAADDVGGRIRSTRGNDGFILDRGFQVLLDAYPAASRWIDYEPLALGTFDAAALLWTGRRLVPLANPFRHPAGSLRDLTSRILPAGDKVRLAALGARAALAPWQSANQAATSLGNDISGSEFLWSQGFSETFVDRLARPFWGGITLDPHLSGSAGPLLFTLKMFLKGSAVLPAAGVRAMPAQLQNRLPEGAITFKARVTSIVIEEGRATGVRVNRKMIRASAVIVASDPVTAKKLTRVRTLPDEEQGIPSVTVFLAGSSPPGTGPRLVLDATRQRLVNHLAPLSAVQPAYAPPGQHLLAAVIVGEAARTGDLDALSLQAREDAAMMLGHRTQDWHVLDVVRVPFSQFSQPPGIYRRLPGNVTPTRGLYLASEATVDSSYNGAMLSGEVAAGIVRRDLATASGAD